MKLVVYLHRLPKNLRSQSQRQQNRGSSCQDREASNRPNDNKHCRIEALLAVQDGLLDGTLISLFAGACHANGVTSSNGTTIGELTKVNQNPSSVQLETSCTESDFYKLTFVTADFAVHFSTPSSLEQAFPWNHTSTDPSQNGWYSEGLERICDANGWRVDKCDGLYRERIAQGYLYLCDPE